MGNPRPPQPPLPSQPPPPPPKPKGLGRSNKSLESNPGEGTALERLWKAYSEAGLTSQLLGEYRTAAGATATFGREMVLGLLLKKAGELEAAAAAFERAGRLDPKSAGPLLALGRLRAVQGNPKAAAACLESAAALLEPSDPRRLDTLMELGNVWLAAGDPNRAAEAWEKTVALSPQNAALRRRLAESYMQNQLPERALGHLEFLRKNGAPAERAQALEQLARLHQGAGRPSEAIAALEEALAATAPGHWLRAELQSRLIRLHQRYQRVPELEERWKAVARENPRDLTSYLQLLDLYRRVGDLSQERQWLEKLIVLAPKTAEYRLRLARLCSQMDDLERAAALYDQLLGEQPANPDLVFERARIDIQRDLLPQAGARVSALLKLKPTDQALRQKALGFYQNYRFDDLTEALLRQEAGAGGEEAGIALANFYFAHKRPRDAQLALEALVAKSASGQAPVYFRVAQIFKDQGDLPAAIRAVERAIALSPESREYSLLLGELSSDCGLAAPARAAYQNAYLLSHTPAEALEADQKLFECLRRQAATLESPDSAPVQEYLLELTRAAAANPQPESWMRVARWQLWSRSPHAARECALRAFALDDHSLPALEFLVKLATAEQQLAQAREHLGQLAKLDPSRAGEYQSQIGRLELQDGRVGEALRIFTELAENNPGNAQALTDLAQAQQRAEMWTEALATLRRAYTLTPASRRKEVTAALLRTFEQLSMNDEAARLLLAQIDAQTEQKEQFALFGDLLGYCVKNGLLGWLKTQFVQRRQAHADDYFIGMALGRILKATGDKAGAFALLAESSFAAANPADTLPELVREAEELRKPDAAVRLQAQLIRLAPQTRPDRLEKLAELEEKSLEIQDASRTWQRILMQFPREAGSLQHAADFELRWGRPAQALELLRRVRVLEPDNALVLSTLGGLAAAAGATAEAESALEDLLKSTAAEKPGDPIRFPALQPLEFGEAFDPRAERTPAPPGPPSSSRTVAGSLRESPAFWPVGEGGAAGERDLRLGAIRDLAQMTAAKKDSAALAHWVARWQKAAAASPGEALWACFYARASGALLDQLEALASHGTARLQCEQAFIHVALESGQLGRLARWLPGRNANMREYLLSTLSERAAADLPALVGTLLPGRMMLWQAAMTLANRNRLAEAAGLGLQVFDGLSTQRPAYGLELAHWQLYLGQTEAARTLLRRSVTTPGESFEAPVFSAIRELYLLLPPLEQGEFANSLLHSLDPAAQPLHAALCATLLHGLNGNHPAAREQLHRLLEMRPLAPPADDEPETAAARYWKFVLNTGTRLQLWNMEALAAALWEEALRDEALIRLQSQPQFEQVQSRILEVRTRLTALKLLKATPAEAQRLITAYDHSQGVLGLLPLAETLQVMGAHRLSIGIYRQLWESEPANPHALRNLLEACRNAADSATLQEVLSRCLTEGYFRANESTQRDLAVQLVEALAPEAGSQKCLALLQRLLKDSPRDSRLLLRIAQLYEQDQRFDSAEAVLRSLLEFQSGNAGARLALATNLEARNRLQPAIEVLEKAGNADTEAKLIDLYAKAERFEEAAGVLEHLPATHQPAATLVLAGHLVKKGRTTHARSILRAALARCRDSRSFFALQSLLLSALAPTDDPALIRRELQRLRQSTGENPDRLTGYFAVALRESTRLGTLEDFTRELEADWAEGRCRAALTLLELCLQQGKLAAARTLNEALLARADLDEAVALKLVTLWTQAAQPELALRVRERLARLTPLDIPRLLELAGEYCAAASNQTAKGLDLLEELSARRVINPQTAGQIAQAYLAAGSPQRARPLFEEAIAVDPLARDYRVYLDFAGLLTNEHNYVRATYLLRTAFNNPLNKDWEALVKFILAISPPEHFDAQLAQIVPAVAARNLYALRQALFSALEATGSAEAALALVEAHPEIADRSLRARLRVLCPAHQERLKALFQLLRTGQPDPLLDGE